MDLIAQLLMHALLNKPLRIAVHIACWIPLAWLLWDAYTDNLTFNPIQEITFRTGKTALILLVLSLSCTPLNTVFGLKQVLPLRRPLGLYAFLYAALHFSIFVWLDYGFDVQLIRRGDRREALCAGRLHGVSAAAAAGDHLDQGLDAAARQALETAASPGVRRRAAGRCSISSGWSRPTYASRWRMALRIALLFVLRAPPVRRAITRFRQRRMGTPAKAVKASTIHTSGSEEISPRP